MSSNWLSWLREREEKQRKEWARETYEDLIIQASRRLSFIEGQLQYGVYDSQDIFGACGHVSDLYLIQEVIFQKAQEQGIQNPYNAFAESYELQSHRVTGPKPPATLV